MTNTLNWKHVNFSEPDGVDWVRNHSGISSIAADAMLDEESRPRILQTDNGLLIILRGVNLNQGSKVEDMVSLRIWLEQNRLVTVSRRQLKSLDEIRRSIERGGGPATPAQFLIDLLNRLGDYIGETVDRLEQELEQAEKEVNDSAIIAKNSPFSVLRRQTARIRRYLAPQREALDRLAHISAPVLDQVNVLEIREQLNRLTLILEDLDLVRERAMVAQEEFLGILAHEQNARMLVLSIVAAVFLPLSFLTGLMGMNVAGLPGTENTWAFGILVIMMLLITALIFVLFKIKRWF